MPTYEHKGSVHLYKKKKEVPGWLIGLAVVCGFILLAVIAG